MQTFLPLPDFEKTAKVLDWRRLGKQRVETFQILTTLLTGRGWIHHPAVKMWEGWEEALVLYQDHICDEWMFRGHHDTLLDRTRQLYLDAFGTAPNVGQSTRLPSWFGLPEMTAGYQSNLIAKGGYNDGSLIPDPYYYKDRFPGVPDDLPYYWPV